MPSTSAAQAKLMSAIAHGWRPAGYAQSHLPSPAVAKEFHEADKKKGEYMHYKAEGGKVGALVSLGKGLMDRIEGAFHNPYTANPDQVRQDIARYWHMNQPPASIAAPAKPAEPSIDDLTAQLHDLASKSYADGGAVEPKHRVRTYSSASPGVSADPLQLISHAADRVSAAVSDDPHHMLARLAGGLSSQLAGLSPSGRAEFGRVPGLVDEAKSLPAGLADIGHAGADIAGLGADLAQQHGYNAPGVTAAQAIRSGLDRLFDRYGSALDSGRAAGARADQLHQAVGKQMGLTPAHGFAEHAADAAGTMLGQLPILGPEEKGASVLAKLAKSPIEWLSPSVRPSAANYGIGALAGALMNTGADESGHPVQRADNSVPMQERFE